MKNRLFKLFNLFLVLIILISFTGCGKKQEEKEPDKAPENEVVEPNTNEALLWEVKSDTATIYLAGSIHVGGESTYPLQQKLLDAFNASEAIAVEADVVAFQQDSAAMQKMAAMMLYDDGTNLTNHLTEEELELFNEYVKEYGIGGLKYEQLELLYMYEPIYLWNFISTDIIPEAGFDATSGIDMYFLNEAKAKNMEVIEVESVEFQYQMLDSFSPELQIFLLMTSIQLPRETSVEEMKDLLEMWEVGDVEGFELYVSASDSTEGLTEEQIKFMEEYNNAFIIERNYGMADKVEELLEGDKDVFYMVGSAHMVGEEGIIKILEERGYTVTKL